MVGASGRASWGGIVGVAGGEDGDGVSNWWLSEAAGDACRAVDCLLCDDANIIIIIIIMSTMSGREKPNKTKPDHNRTKPPSPKKNDTVVISPKKNETPPSHEHYEPVPSTPINDNPPLATG